MKVLDLSRDTGRRVEEFFGIIEGCESFQTLDTAQFVELHNSEVFPALAFNNRLSIPGVVTIPNFKKSYNFKCTKFQFYF